MSLSSLQDLMSLPAAAADIRASALGLRWGFPNNYTLSKHLAEQLVQHYHHQEGLPVCIVRPSLVCAVLYQPIPGHVVRKAMHGAVMIAVM